MSGQSRTAAVHQEASGLLQGSYLSTWWVGLGVGPQAGALAYAQTPFLVSAGALTASGTFFILHPFV